MERAGEKDFSSRPPTGEEAIIMLEEQWLDIRKKHVVLALSSSILRTFQKTVGGLKTIMPRGRKRLLS